MKQIRLTWLQRAGHLLVLNCEALWPWLEVDCSDSNGQVSRVHELQYSLVQSPYSHLSSRMHAIDLLHVSRVTCPFQDPVNVELVRVLDKIIEVAE